MIVKGECHPIIWNAVRNGTGHNEHRDYKIML